MNSEFFSREKAAGYEPAVLNNSTLLLVGVGALGQNALLNLALSQVGTVLVVDCDRWEAHNATRSPFYPSECEVLKWGNYKASVAAHKVRQMISWSPSPQLRYANEAFQALGDAPFRAADVVVCAVDSQLARDYIGSKAAQFRIPLVEGGFSGSHVNSTILLHHVDDDPCWHCNQYRPGARNRDIQLGCTKVARQAEESGFVPALQSAAAFLGSFMSEAAIQLMHGNTELGNHLATMNVRTGSAAKARLRGNPECSHHTSRRKTACRLNLTAETSCRQLLTELSQHIDHPSVALPFSFVVRVGCAQCKQPISVNRPEWVMANLLFCQECGGPWKRTATPGVDIFSSLSHDVTPPLDLSIAQVGLMPGSFVEIETRGESVFCELMSNRDLPKFQTVTEGESPWATASSVSHQVDSSRRP